MSYNDRKSELFMAVRHAISDKDARMGVSYHLGHLLADARPHDTIGSSFARAYRTLIHADGTNKRSEAMEHVMSLFDAHADRILAIDYSRRNMSGQVLEHYLAQQRTVADARDLRMRSKEPEKNERSDIAALVAAVYVPSD